MHLTVIASTMNKFQSREAGVYPFAAVSRKLYKKCWLLIRAGVCCFEVPDMSLLVRHHDSNAMTGWQFSRKKRFQSKVDRTTLSGDRDLKSFTRKIINKFLKQTLYQGGSLLDIFLWLMFFSWNRFNIISCD